MGAALILSRRIESERLALRGLSAARRGALARAAQRVAIALVLVYLAWWAWQISMPFGLAGDFDLYVAIGHRILAGGPLYTDAQLAGPHVTLVGDAMYPPSTMPLILAFAIMPDLPARLLWYAIPIVVTLWCTWRLRPTGWPAVAALCLFAAPSSVVSIYLGNPVIWATMAVALGTLYRWPAVFVLLKPSYVLFAIPGLIALPRMSSRLGWAVVGAFALGSAVVLPVTIDWFRVMLNARGDYSGVGYALANLPLLVAPWVAWYGRSRPTPDES